MSSSFLPIYCLLVPSLVPYAALRLRERNWTLIIWKIEQKGEREWHFLTLLTVDDISWEITSLPLILLLMLLTVAYTEDPLTLRHLFPVSSSLLKCRDSGIGYTRGVKRWCREHREYKIKVQYKERYLFPQRDSFPVTVYYSCLLFFRISCNLWLNLWETWHWSKQWRESKKFPVQRTW